MKYTVEDRIKIMDYFEGHKFYDYQIGEDSVNLLGEFYSNRIDDFKTLETLSIPFKFNQTETIRIFPNGVDHLNWAPNSMVFTNDELKCRFSISGAHLKDLSTLTPIKNCSFYDFTGSVIDSLKNIHQNIPAAQTLRLPFFDEHSLDILRIEGLTILNGRNAGSKSNISNELEDTSYPNVRSRKRLDVILQNLGHGRQGLLRAQRDFIELDL